MFLKITKNAISNIADRIKDPRRRKTFVPSANVNHGIFAYQRVTTFYRRKNRITNDLTLEQTLYK